MSSKEYEKPVLQHYSAARFLRILCPTFCRYKKKEESKKNEEMNKINEWQISEEQLNLIFKFLRIEEETNVFEGILPYTLHNVWEDFMMPELYVLWITYIFGTMDDIVPDYRRFCDLVKCQSSGPLTKRARAILSIILQKNYEEIEENNLKVPKYDVNKYFFNLMATYIRGMGYRNNPEFLMWVSCDADFNETNLRIAMGFISSHLTDMVDSNLLCNTMEDFSFLRNVLTSVIKMSFGIAQVSNVMIPFPISHAITVLDIAQVVMLTSFIKEKETDLYEWEMLYSIEHQGFHSLSFIHSILKKGPTVIVLKDQDGWMFGGFTDESWVISPNFTGSSRCFLFRLVPRFKIFMPSLEDENFMFLDIGPQQVNSLAMGGYKDYYGLWISLEKPLGRCENYCTTFKGYECLSSMNNFHYVNLEVWRVGLRDLSVTKSSLSNAVNDTSWLVPSSQHTISSTQSI